MLPPAKTPAEPMPLNARPTMNAGDDWAVAETVDPMMKRSIEPIKISFMAK